MHKIFYSPGIMGFSFTAKLLLLIFLIAISGFFIIFKNRNLLLTIVSIILTIILIANTIYYRHFNDFLSINLIGQVTQLKEVSSNILILFKFSDFLYVVDYLVLFIYYIFVIKKRPHIYEKDIINNGSEINQVIIYFCIPFVSILLFIGSLFYVYSNTQYFERRNANRIIVSLRSMYFYNILDTVSYIGDQRRFKNIDEDELIKINSYFSHKNKKENKDNYYGVFKDKNILFIQEESLSEYVINKKINGKEITPNINSLIKKSYYNNNFYAEIGGGHSADAELIALTGLYPFKNKSVNLNYAYHQYDTIVKKLKKEGYYTFSAHSYKKDFWNRENMHKQYGFDDSFFQDSFDDKSDKIGWGITDEELFKQTINKIKNNKKPFLGYIVTLENHTPFEIDDKYKKMNIDDSIKSNLTRNYIQVCHNVDESIGILIEELKRNNLYDNTIIVLFGDHDAELLKKDCSGLTSLNDSIDFIKNNKVPFLIHSPNVDKSFNFVDSELAGQTDILPTISWLLGIENSKYIVGSNIFAKNRNKLVSLIRHGVLLNDKYVCLKGVDKDIVYDINSRKEVNNIPYDKQTFNKFDILYDFSEKIIGGNLIDKLNQLKKE